jgi:hypothetical protein
MALAARKALTGLMDEVKHARPFVEPAGRVDA